MRLNYRLCALALTVFIYANSPTIFAGEPSAENQAQLYFFTNAGCAPCRQVEPEIEKLYREGYRVMKIDTSIHPDWTQRFQVSKTPTVVMVAGNKVVGRKSGYVDANTLRQWFKLVDNANQLQAEQSKHPRAKSDSNISANRQSVAIRPNNDPTKGTFIPVNDVQRLAIQATVRLRIDDPEGSSYATGTVIHSFEGEALVLTCGHVFRDSNGKGKITAEFGFADHDLKTANGQLIFYDADARDIGLVAISTSENIEPISIANVSYPIQTGNEIFSIGCDNGQRPSIRNSRLKNTAKYDGVNKYEIYGRPVNGRSGGGLFTSDGKLVGVCNAAVVDVDEGVYVALDTIHWQFEQVNLAHLFEEKSIARTPETQIAAVKPRRRPHQDRPFQILADDMAVMTKRNNPNEVNTTNVVNSNTQSQLAYAQPQTELIVVLRNSNSSESWTVRNPSDDLIDSLRQMKSNPKNHPQSVPNRMARLRNDMPNLQNVNGKTYNSNQMRAQSPR